MSNRFVPWCPLLIGAVVAATVGWMSWRQDTHPDAGFLQRLEWMSHDWRARRAFKAGASASDLLGLVVIDNTTLEDINKKQGFNWPLPRYFYGHMVDELKQQGARGVAVDIFFITDDSRSDSLQVPLPAGGSIGSDDFFALHLKESGNVILGAPPNPKGGSLVLPVPKFRSPALALGHGAASADDDGIMRRLKPYVDDPVAGRVWQLGIALAARGLGIDLQKAQVESGRITLTTADGQKRILPLDSRGYLMVDWSAPFGDTRLTAQNLLTVIGANAHRIRGGDVKNVWKDKLVVVGSTGVGNNISDRGATPLSKDTKLMSAHWNIANSILMDRQITPLGFGARLGLLAVLCGIASLVAWKLRPMFSTLVALIIGAIYVFLCLGLFNASRLSLPMVLPLVALAVAHAAAAVCRSFLLPQARAA